MPDERKQNAVALAYVAKKNSEALAKGLAGSVVPRFDPAAPAAPPDFAAALGAPTTPKTALVPAQAAAAPPAPDEGLFLREYVRLGYDAIEAARRAGYPKPHIAGPNLIKKASIQRAITAIEGAALTAADLTNHVVLQEIVRIVKFDPGSLKNDDGTWKQLSELTKDQRAALAAIETGPYGVKYKTHDKLKALALAMDALGMKQVAINVNHSGGIEHRLNLDTLSSADLDHVLSLAKASDQGTLQESRAEVIDAEWSAPEDTETP